MACSQQQPSNEHVVSLSFTPHTSIHVRITNHALYLMVHLTSTTHATTSGTSALGSFVYALPNRLDTVNTLGTPLVTVPNSVDFAMRAAKILARRLGKPTYVSNSIDLSWGPGNAGAPEVGEEIEALRKVIETVTKQVGGEVNGTTAAE